ncbi:hypothetical protein ABK040_002077 [Willaertia magna]
MSSSEDMSKKVVQGCFGHTDYSLGERDFLQRELLKKLDSDAITKRPGPNGQQVHYIETWKAIELANQLFGFNGWSSSIMEINNDYIDQTPQGKFNCGVSAIIRVSLKDGSFHEDIGYGVSDNQKHKGAAFEQAKKTAVSDGLKRALRNFGNALGLTIYDREHLKTLKPKKNNQQNNNSQRPVNPYFSQQIGGSSPNASQILSTTQQNLESIDDGVNSSMQSQVFQRPNSTMNATNVNDNNQEYDNLNDNEPSLNIDDNLEDTSGLDESIQAVNSPQNNNNAPKFVRPSAPKRGNETQPQQQFQPGFKKNKM